jgi:hypothetical protein
MRISYTVLAIMPLNQKSKLWSTISGENSIDTSSPSSFPLLSLSSANSDGANKLINSLPRLVWN